MMRNLCQGGVKTLIDIVRNWDNYLKCIEKQGDFMSNNIPGINGVNQVNNTPPSNQSRFNQLTSIVNTALNQLTNSTPEPRVVENLTSTSTLITPPPAQDLSTILAITADDSNENDLSAASSSSEEEESFDCKIPDCIPDLLSIQGKFKRAQNLLEKIALLYDFHFFVQKGKWRPSEREILAGVFMEQLALLPEEVIFPMGEGDKTIKQLLIEIDELFEGWHNPFRWCIIDFCKKLQPIQAERFMKLLSLPLIPCNRARGLWEINQRNNQGLIDDQAFRQYFDKKVTYGHMSNFSSLLVEAPFFLAEVSIPLLERILLVYSEKVDLSGDTVKAFKSSFTNYADAFQKLQLLVRWYHKEAKNWNMYNRASQFLGLLEIIDVMMERKDASILSFVQGRETRRLKPSEQIVLTKSVVRSWLPDEYNTYEKFLDRMLYCFCPKAEYYEKFRKYFE
jgi:hypothetical protein